MPGVGAQLPAVRSAQAAGPITPAAVRLDRRLLYSYAAYLNAVMASAGTAQAADTTYVGQVTAQCRSTLVPLMQPAQQIDTTARHTLTVLGMEIGDDLSLSFDQTFLPAFTRFAAALRRLQWGKMTSATLIIRRYLAAEHRVLVMSRSQLCQDAELAGTDPQLIPPGTSGFLKLYTRAAIGANLALTDLLKLMVSYETPREKLLVARIASLADQVTSLTKSSLTAAGALMTTALETS